jgi:hypothetical protein
MRGTSRGTVCASFLDPFKFGGGSSSTQFLVVFLCELYLS